MMALSTDLVCLVSLTLFGVALAHLPALARMRAAGVGWGLGNRAQQPAVPDWVDRADRAHRNLLDNLPLYAVAILTVALVGRSDAVSAAAALTLVGARLLHAITYIGGITALGLRSAAYFVAFGATLTILSRLL